MNNATVENVSASNTAEAAKARYIELDRDQLIAENAALKAALEKFSADLEAVTAKPDAAEAAKQSVAAVPAVEEKTIGWGGIVIGTAVVGGLIYGACRLFRS